MKILSFEKSVLLKLGILAREEGQIYLPDLIGALAQQFSFVKYPDPTSINEDERAGLVFFQGKFKKFAVDSLGIYSDGIVIKSNTDTSNLDELAEFLERWAKKEFGVEFIASNSATTIYESNLIVQANSESIAKIFQKLTKLEKSLSTKVQENSNFAASFSLSGFSIGADFSQIENFKPAQFRFERRIGTERKLRQFFSTAPLTTASHLALLNELEAMA